MHPIERLRYFIRDHAMTADELVAETIGAMAGLGDDHAASVNVVRRVLERHVLVGPLWWMAARVLTAPNAYAEGRQVVADLGADRTSEEVLEVLRPLRRVACLGWPGQAALALVLSEDLDILVIDADGEGDPTASQLAAHGAESVSVVRWRDRAAAIGSCDLVIAESQLCGPRASVAVHGSGDVLGKAVELGVPASLVAGIGCRLPAWLFDGISARIEVAVAESQRGGSGRAMELVTVGEPMQLVGEFGTLRVPPISPTAGFPRATELLASPAASRQQR